MYIVDFWGKAQSIRAEPYPQWHPVVFHSLDVAAVSFVLLSGYPKLADHLARLLGLRQQDAINLVSQLACLHDIGKFAKRFQAKVPRHYPDCFGDDASRISTSYDHGAGGLRLFDADASLFRLPEGNGSRIWRPLVSAATGHHGAPPTPQMSASGETLRTLQSCFGKSGIEAARLFAHRVGGLFAPPDGLPSLERKRVRRASFALAGLCILADWIGSNQNWFPYRSSHEFACLEDYWAFTQEQAGRAITAAGVLPARVCSSIGYDALIGAGRKPTPMQTWARTVALPTSPSLFLIEDETGSGKTEAAMMLAHRLMASGHADGLYVALPTMATANAMFDRLGAACRALFAPGAEPSIALAHGAREMHPGFRRASLPGGRVEVPYSSAGGEDEATASTACADWIADDRRRAFLADAGAGTVDQALLSVLPSRHQSLRLLGLMRRVLILDEVHAYDAYMQQEIDALLEFQAGLGGCAILLSATLPAAIRRRLTRAFARGLGEPAGTAENAECCSTYPLATTCTVGVSHSMKVASRPDQGRVLPVRFLNSCKEALQAAEEAAQAGKAVLYVRNTVDDTLDAYSALATRNRTPMLFHARFALIDRLTRERKIMKTFGKGSHPEARAGRILVATQVVEQSLDLDFDAMLTDLAPIDLIIQRAGRLWRHDRRERAGRPELLVIGPKPERDADEDWFRRAFPRAAYVYRDHARLWLTAHALEKAAAIESPSGLRALIEAVYGGDADACVPEGLLGVYFEAEGRAKAESSVANQNTLSLAKGYARDSGAWDIDARTPTRHTDDLHVTLRLARARGGRVVPYALYAAPDETWRAWRLSEISISARRVGGEAELPSNIANAAREAKAGWTRFDKEKLLIVLEEHEGKSGALIGRALAGDGSQEVRIGYDPLRGLQFLPDAP